MYSMLQTRSLSCKVAIEMHNPFLLLESDHGESEMQPGSWQPTSHISGWIPLVGSSW
jgi:hypothetical protein